MIEAALGADAVTVHEANEFIERMDRGDSYMTNSCCPGFLSFIEKAKTPFHAVGELAKKLESEGYQRLVESQNVYS